MGDLLPETREAIDAVERQMLPPTLYEQFEQAVNTSPASHVRDVLAHLLADPAARAALAKEWWRHTNGDEDAEARAWLHRAVHGEGSESLSALTQQVIAERVNRAAIEAGEAPPGMERVAFIELGNGERVAVAADRLFRLAPEEQPMPTDVNLADLQRHEFGGGLVRCPTAGCGCALLPTAPSPHCTAGHRWLLEGDQLRLAPEEESQQQPIRLHDCGRFHRDDEPCPTLPGTDDPATS